MFYKRRKSRKQVQGVPTNDSIAIVSFKLPRSLLDTFDQRRHGSSLTRSELLRYLVAEYLKYTAATDGNGDS